MWVSNDIASRIWRGSGRGASSRIAASGAHGSRARCAEFAREVEAHLVGVDQRQHRGERRGVPADRAAPRRRDRARAPFASTRPSARRRRRAAKVASFMRYPPLRFADYIRSYFLSIIKRAARPHPGRTAT